jgi:hypothetical protein
MEMSTPSWNQFARDICWSPEISHALRLLALEAQIPEQGRPTRFRCDGLAVERTPAGEFICWRGSAGAGRSSVAGNGDEVLSALAPIPAHGASGAALREWLMMWGWTPPPRRRAAMAQP